MTQITERLELPAYDRAWEYLNRTVCKVSEHQPPEHVRLRVPIGGSGSPALEKEVVVAYDNGPGTGAERAWSLSWRPADGPYPTFNGTLTLEFAGTKPVLVLRGEYTPPLGAVGEAFDSVVGSRIASVTAKEFLRTIAEEMAKQHVVQRAMDLPM